MSGSGFTTHELCTRGESKPTDNVGKAGPISMSIVGPQMRTEASAGQPALPGIAVWAVVARQERRKTAETTAASPGPNQRANRVKPTMASGYRRCSVCQGRVPDLKPLTCHSPVLRGAVVARLVRPGFFLLTLPQGVGFRLQTWGGTVC